MLKTWFTEIRERAEGWHMAEGLLAMTEKLCYNLKRGFNRKKPEVSNRGYYENR